VSFTQCQVFSRFDLQSSELGPRVVKALSIVLKYSTISAMKRKHFATLSLIYKRPVSGNIKWANIEALFRELGAEVEEREGSRVSVMLFGVIKVFHRSHPSPDTDKGAIAAIRNWLQENGITP